jgi:DNA-binding NtrC family response regulator
MTHALAGKRVLIVEDERTIADTLEKIFTDAGYDTLAVYSAEAALEFLGDSPWSPDFSVIDVLLPTMNGIDLAIHLKTAYPDRKFTLFSGQSETMDLLEKAKLDGHDFDVLAKPIHPAELLTLICHALSPPAASGGSGSA